MKLPKLIDKVKVYLNEYVPELSDDIMGNDSTESNIKSILFDAFGSFIVLIPKKKRPFENGKMAYVDGLSTVRLTCNESLTGYDNISWKGDDVKVTREQNAIVITGLVAATKNYVHSIVLSNGEGIGAERIVLSKVYDLIDSANDIKFSGTILKGYKTASEGTQIAIYCPPNYVSLNYFKANSWPFPTFKTYSIDSPEYYFENSQYTKRKCESKLFEVSGDFPKLLHFDPTISIGEFSYHPHLEPEDVPGGLVDLLCIYSAIVYASIKQIESTALSALFKSKLDELSAS